MKHKKWAISCLSLTLATLVVFAGIMAFTDPMLRYGKEKDIFTYYEYSENYGNPGIARQYEYDTVLIGTSMVQNTDADECDEAFGCRTVKLPYSGGTSYNMKRILDICFDTDNDIKKVLWGLDEFQLLGSSSEPRYPLPEYLYEESHWGDISYLLNLDIFYHYTLNNVLGTLRGEKQQLMRSGERLWGDFSKEGTLSTYSRPLASTRVRTFEEIKRTVDANLDKNILPLVEENSETEFVFFMVPYSILYWDNEVRKGTFESTMDAVEYSLGKLLAYDNVTVFFYQNETDIITNLDNYKDFTHYGKWINSFMTQSMAKGYGKVTKDTYQETLDKMRADMLGYDFDAIFE